MKGKQLCGIALASVLILSGCSSTVQENGKDVLASIDGKNVLADDVYTSLSSSKSGQTALFNYVLEKLVNEKLLRILKPTIKVNMVMKHKLN